MNFTSKVLEERTPLSPKDCFYIADREKTEFTYPIHRHNDFELNFVANAKGVKRVVGNSEELIGDYDLVLIANGKMEHAWLQHECRSQSIREITIQFAPALCQSVENKNQFRTIGEMLRKAQSGISFPLSAIMKVHPMLDRLTSRADGFYAVIDFMKILYELSLFSDQATILATSPYAELSSETDKKIMKVQLYIAQNYREDVTLQTLSELVGMSPSGLSRFFSQEKGLSISEYLIEQRLNHATRLLIDTNLPIREICISSGFNNVSNFNRQFRKNKSCSPSQFRENYSKKKLII